MYNHPDSLHLLEQDLGRQARIFTAQNGSGEDELPTALVIADLEFRWERSLHAAYSMQEGAEAAAIRWPFDRVAAVSWITLRFVPGETTPEISGPIVLAADESDEVAMVSSLFDALNADPKVVLTTWGGENRDIAVLRRCAAQHGLILPQQLRSSSPYAPGRMDLCRATAGLADKVHLGEFATALSIPAKPTPAKEIGKLAECGEWKPVREQCLADVLTTSLLVVRHLASLGAIGCDQIATDTAIAEVAARTQPGSAFVTRTLQPWSRARQARGRLKGVIYRADAAIPLGVAQA